MRSTFMITRVLLCVALSLLVPLLSFQKDIYIIKIHTTAIEIPKYHAVHTGIPLIDGGIDDVVTSVTTASNKYIGVQYIYRTHIIGYCEGKANNQIATTCTYTYDVLGSLKEQITGGIIGDVGLLTKGVETALQYLIVLYRTIFTMYFMSTLAVVFSILFSFTEHDQADFILKILALITLVIASALGTTFALKLQYLIDTFLADLGIVGSYSSLYILLTWTSVALILGAVVSRVMSLGLVQPPMAAGDSFSEATVIVHGVGSRV